VALSRRSQPTDLLALGSECENEVMAGSGDDDLDRLLREVDAMTSGKPAPAAGKAAAVPRGKSVANSDDKKSMSEIARTGVIAGAVSGVVVGTLVFLLQWLPLIGHPISSALAAFAGAFFTAVFFGYRNRD
jgi:hypothetical protein